MKIILMFMFIFVNINTFSQNVYWRGTVNSNWNVGLNWVGNVVPNNKNAIIDPTVQSYTYPPIISANSTFTPKQVQVLNGGTLTIQKNLTTTDKITVDGSTSTLNMTGGTVIIAITAGKNFNIQNKATFNFNGGTIYVGGDMKIDKGGVVNMDKSVGISALHVYGKLSIKDISGGQSSIFNMAGDTVSVASDMELDGNGNSATPTLNVSNGLFTVNGNTLFMGTTSDIPHIIVSGGAVTLVGDVARKPGESAYIDIDVSAIGLLIFQGNLNMNNAADRFDQNGMSSIIKFQNTKNWTNSGIYNATAGTAIFDGSTTLLNNGTFNFYHLTINNGKTLNQSGPANINIGGDWTNSGGTFVENLNTVTFNGTNGNQTINNTADETYYNLIIDNSTGTINLAAFTDIVITHILILRNGVVVTGNNLCIFSSTVASNLAYTNGFIYGTFRRYITPNTNTYFFPVGNGITSAHRHLMAFINNSITGVAYLDASVTNFTQISPNDDASLNTTQNSTNIKYTAGESEGTTVIWTLTPSAIPSGGTYGVQLYVENTNLSAADDNLFCPLKRNNTTSYANFLTYESITTIPASGAAGRIYNAGKGYAQRTGYTSFSEFVIGKSDNEPLPIELISFNAKKYNNKVKIEWTTLSEINNDYFTVEKSSDGLTFVPVGIVKGAGESKSIRNYYLIDDEPYLGVSYYRLKQTDFDGKYKYSNTVSIINSLSDITIINTSNGIINILYNNNQNDISSIEIYNTLGYKVYYSNTYHQSTIDISNQKNGIYILRCNLLNKIFIQKIIKIF